MLTELDLTKLLRGPSPVLRAGLVLAPEHS
jgi:hypothetical protein